MSPPHSSSKKEPSKSSSKTSGSSRSHHVSTWMQEQARTGPWEGLGEVNGEYRPATTYGEYSYEASIAATQGSARKASHSHKHGHKSSGKK